MAWPPCRHPGFSLTEYLRFIWTPLFCKLAEVAIEPLWGEIIDSVLVIRRDEITSRMAGMTGKLPTSSAFLHISQSVGQTDRRRIFFFFFRLCRTSRCADSERGSPSCHRETSSKELNVQLERASGRTTPRSVCFGKPQRLLGSITVLFSTASSSLYFILLPTLSFGLSYCFILGQKKP